MSPEKTSLSERVQASYSNLASVASDLNSVSDELGKSISEMDGALKKLNLGVTTWVVIRAGGATEEEPRYFSEEFGYAKVDGKWGISIRSVSGNCERSPDEERVEQWLFNDAPRSLRLSAIAKIPELLEKMAVEADKTAKDVRTKLVEAQEVAAVVTKAAQIPGKAVSAKLVVESNSLAGVPPIVKKIIQGPHTASAQYTIHVNPAESKEATSSKTTGPWDELVKNASSEVKK